MEFLRLKHRKREKIIGVEYYQAVIRDGVAGYLADLRNRESNIVLRSSRMDALTR